MATASSASRAAALARASMTFATKQRRKAGRSIATGPNEAIALVELTTTFVSTCSVALTPAALNKLTVFFQITIGRLIKTGKMGWVGEGRRRTFSLECAAYLAESSESIATGQGSRVTPRVLERAAAEMIEAKRPNCPLPNSRQRSPLKVLGTCCTDLAKEISTRLQS